VNGQIRITEQGEIISSKYSNAEVVATIWKFWLPRPSKPACCNRGKPRRQETI